LANYNIKIFKSLGEALNLYAAQNVKVVVAVNPYNTNTLMCSKFAPRIDKCNFSAVSHLATNRGRNLIK
jgi:malate/lactate dehydrogenase